MHEQTSLEPDGEEQKPVREPYAPPRLVRHGTVEDLTRGVQSIVIGDGISTLT